MSIHVLSIFQMINKITSPIMKGGVIMNAWLELFLILAGIFIVGITIGYFYNLYRDKKLQNYINSNPELSQQQKDLEAAIEIAEDQYDEWLRSIMEQVWGY